VPSVLFIIRDLDYGGTARQLCLLAEHLPRPLFTVRVCVLGRSAPWVEMLRKAGLAVEVLGWHRPFDVAPVLALRRLVRDLRADVIHVWGQVALRALMATGGPDRARLLLSAALTPGHAAGRLDRWLWRKAERIVALGDSEAERYRRLGVPPEQLRVIWPAVSVTPSDNPPGAHDPGLALSPELRLLLTLGPFAAHKGQRDAAWALDILHYLYDNLHLVLAGTGPELARVRHFTHFLGVARHVHFPGACADVGPLLRRAELVWVPCRSGGGVNAALEAMAAGKPVVASRLPGLAEIVVEGVTGFLVEPGDKAELARQTRLLLDNPERGRQIGAAGRQRVAEHFTVERLVERCARLYSFGKDEGKG